MVTKMIKLTKDRLPYNQRAKIAIVLFAISFAFMFGSVFWESIALLVIGAIVALLGFGAIEN